MFYWFVTVILTIVSKILFCLTTTGSKNLPKRGAFILASNHKSHLDPVVLVSSSRRKLFFMAKEELRRSALGNFFFTSCETIKLDRDGSDRAALKAGLEVLCNGRALALFPEGTRSKDGTLGEGKLGVAMFAFNAHVPVVPAFVSGTERALPSGSHSLRPARVRVRFGKPIMPHKIADRSQKKAAYQEFTKTIMQEISDLGKEAG